MITQKHTHHKETEVITPIPLRITLLHDIFNQKQKQGGEEDEEDTTILDGKEREGRKGGAIRKKGRENRSKKSFYTWSRQVLQFFIFFYEIRSDQSFALTSPAFSSAFSPLLLIAVASSFMVTLPLLSVPLPKKMTSTVRSSLLIH